MQLKRSCLVLLCGALPVWCATPKASAAPKAAGIEGKLLPAPEPAAPFTAKVIHYSEREVARVNTKLRYTTLIMLPKNEQILDYACGDRDFWVINGSYNLAYVKPAKGGARTNLNLVTASGNVYSFVLVEVSETPTLEPDLKVFVELNDESMMSAAGSPPKFVPALEVEHYRQQLATSKEEIRQVKQASQSAIDSGISRFISNVRFPYRFEAGKKPFFVRAMYNDDKFTYIQARPEETPTVYELKDGKPNLVNFDYKDGVYLIGKILDRGYLVVGKQKLGFKRED